MPSQVESLVRLLSSAHRTGHLAPAAQLDALNAATVAEGYAAQAGVVIGLVAILDGDARIPAEMSTLIGTIALAAVTLTDILRPLVTRLATARLQPAPLPRAPPDQARGRVRGDVVRRSRQPPDGLDRRREVGPSPLAREVAWD